MMILSPSRPPLTTKICHDAPSSTSLFLRKCFRNEDDCAECLTDWDPKGEYHIDLWTGSNIAGGGQDQINLEDSLPGGSQTIILDPPNSLPVDTTPLYDQPTNQSHETTYSIPDSSTLCASGS
ncbi:hypothetical protein IMSHALPRED_003643 [Imshaugia aleurites]|uniref:Uncharacterized protein n=1 Tax=Imshaugia aleurites TaxID=172621 RepID=A0A8H3J844_9LECA|nr:hypothetical protein IMSHALPRED_003643 [Imshaugia aleurites]